MQPVGSHIRILRRICALALVAALAACTSLSGGLGSRVPVPEDLVLDAGIPSSGGVAPVRYWGDDFSAIDSAYGNAGLGGAELAALASDPRLDFLSISGGGYNGAFGTGFLLGWSARGDRPQFDIVSGISVGALLAPFAFLGPNYDQQMLAAFDSLVLSNARGAGFLGALFGAPGVESNEPIRRALAAVITDRTVAAIAREHEKGRRLLIGTTNLDAERPVVWDIGAIATSTIADKRGLIRKVLLASAAVPGVYPAVLIEVEANGCIYSELHVDGGVTQQVVLIPDDINLQHYDRAGSRRERNLYIIYNNKLTPDYEPVMPDALGVLRRSVPTFIKYLGRGDIARMRAAAARNGAQYKLTAIPPVFEVKDTFEPDAEYMTTLIRIGFEMGKDGDWTE